ncbi:MAG: TetR/AcrR family transcriptional regulator [Spirochaetaceae bacterium]|nr:MAG: TetR/AcrR family transcriptional regulator [Spirochaetaceae bacterium]
MTATSSPAADRPTSPPTSPLSSTHCAPADAAALVTGLSRGPRLPRPHSAQFGLDNSFGSLYNICNLTNVISDSAGNSRRRSDAGIASPNRKEGAPVPPKTQFTQEQIVEAAFALAVEGGLGAVTARAVAAKLGCSVAPIYVNFATIEELQQAVVHRIQQMAASYVERQSGGGAFERIGRASLAFARDYPALIRERVLSPKRFAGADPAQDRALIAMMAGDPELSGWSEAERGRLLLQMRAFQLGLTLLVANDQIPGWWGDGSLDELLLQTGEELVRGHRREGEKGGHR